MQTIVTRLLLLINVIPFGEFTIFNGKVSISLENSALAALSSSRGMEYT